MPPKVALDYFWQSATKDFRVGLRERKKQRAKKELEQAALELFDQKGFDRTTIKEIAAAAEMSPRTFFRYFESKEDVIFGQTAQDFGALKNCLAERSEDENDIAALRGALIDWADHLEDDRDMIALRGRLINESAVPRRRAAEIRDEAIRMLAEDLGARSGSDDRSASMLIAGVCMQAVNVALYRWSFSNFQRGLRHHVEETFDELEGMFQTAAARSRD